MIKKRKLVLTFFLIACVAISVILLNPKMVKSEDLVINKDISAAVTEETQDKVKNGDFSSHSNGIADDWIHSSTYKMSVVDGALEMDASSLTTKYVWQELNLVPNTYYRLSGKIKASVSSVRDSYSRGASIVCDYNTCLQVDSRNNWVVSSQDWNLTEFYFKTLKDGYVKILLKIEDISGTFFFDDISLEMLDFSVDELNKVLPNNQVCETTNLVISVPEYTLSDLGLSIKSEKIIELFNIYQEAYEHLSYLVDEVIYKGNKLGIYGTYDPYMKQYGGLANYISLLFNERNFRDIIPNYINNGDVGFGVLHEMSHAFEDAGDRYGQIGFGDCTWNFHSEHFANFKMLYLFSVMDNISVRMGIDGIWHDYSNVYDMLDYYNKADRGYEIYFSGDMDYNNVCNDAITYLFGKIVVELFDNDWDSIRFVFQNMKMDDECITKGDKLVKFLSLLQRYYNQNNLDATGTEVIDTFGEEELSILIKVFGGEKTKPVYEMMLGYLENAYEQAVNYSPYNEIEIRSIYQTYLVKMNSSVKIDYTSLFTIYEDAVKAFQIYYPDLCRTSNFYLVSKLETVYYKDKLVLEFEDTNCLGIRGFFVRLNSNDSTKSLSFWADSVSPYVECEVPEGFNGTVDSWVDYHDAYGNVTSRLYKLNRLDYIPSYRPEILDCILNDNIVVNSDTVLDFDVTNSSEYKIELYLNDILYSITDSVSEVAFKSSLLGFNTCRLVLKNTDGYVVDEVEKNFVVKEESLSDSTKIYYSGYENTYIHYCVAGSSWTSAPGIKMQKNNKDNGYDFFYEIELNGSSSVAVCFNDGVGNWDSRNGSNYVLGEGSFGIKNGNIENLPSEGNGNHCDIEVTSKAFYSIGDLIDIEIKALNNKDSLEYRYILIHENIEQIIDINTYRFTEKGSYTLKVYGGNENEIAESEVHFTVYKMLNASVVIEQDVLSVKDTAHIYVYAHGGSTKYYDYSVEIGNVVYNQKEVFFASTDSGTYDVNVTVTDPYTKLSASCKTTITFVADNIEIAGFFNNFKQNKYAYVDKSYELNVTALYGKGILLYEYYLIDENNNEKLVLSSNNASEEIVFSEAGEYTLKVIVTDEDMKSAEKTCNIEVIEAFDITYNALSEYNLNDSTDFDLEVTGGTGDYSIYYYYEYNNVMITSGEKYTYTFIEEGKHRIRLMAIDNNSRDYVERIFFIEVVDNGLSFIDVEVHGNLFVNNELSFIVNLKNGDNAIVKQYVTYNDNKEEFVGNYVPMFIGDYLFEFEAMKNNELVTYELCVKIVVENSIKITDFSCLNASYAYVGNILYFDYSYTSDLDVEIIESVTVNNSINEFTDSYELVNTGEHVFMLVIKDAYGNEATKEVRVNVTNKVEIAAFNAPSNVITGEDTTFTLDVLGGIGEFIYELYVNGAIVQSSTQNDFILSFDEDGIYEVIGKVIDQKNGSIAEAVVSVNASKKQENSVTIFYQGYIDPYIHYRIGKNEWTTAPGVKMSESNKLSGFGYEYEIILGEDIYVEACFNNGYGSWDSNNGNNYIFGTGYYTFINGNIVEIEEPSLEMSFTTSFSKAQSGMSNRISVNPINTGGVVYFSYQVVDGEEVLFDSAFSTNSSQEIMLDVNEEKTFKLIVGVKDNKSEVYMEYEYNVSLNNPNTIVIYTNTYNYVHYSLNNVWTDVPGILMSQSDNSQYKYMITIDCADSTNIVACFNNGLGAWDSNNGANYLLNSGNTYYFD